MSANLADPIEVRDPARARIVLAQALCVQRVGAVSVESARQVLEWMAELNHLGEAFPPPGVVGDIGRLAFGEEVGASSARAEEWPHWPAELFRRYEDYVLGKVDADGSFLRGGDALRHYAAADRARGLGYLVHRFQERAGFGGLRFSPAVIKSAASRPPEEILTVGQDALATEGLAEELRLAYEQLIAAVRHAPEMLGREDVFELESGTAVAAFSQRVALRQVLRVAEGFQSRLVGIRLAPRDRRREIATRLLVEDAYPTGGFSSLSNRGSIESLLHSQLALMEADDRPDLFDIKFARDELLYYSRDENQFLRRRRAFAFLFWPDLALTRIRVAPEPFQRVVLILGTVIAAIRQLTELLSNDALAFHLWFPEDGRNDRLAPEREVIELLLRDQVANGTVRIERIDLKGAEARGEELGRRALTELLSLSIEDRPVFGDRFGAGRLLFGAGPPRLGWQDEEAIAADDGGWDGVYERLIRRWA